MVASPNIGFLVASLLILLGLVFYYPFVYRKIELKAVRKLFALGASSSHGFVLKDESMLLFKRFFDYKKRK